MTNKSTAEKDQTVGFSFGNSVTQTDGPMVHFRIWVGGEGPSLRLTPEEAAHVAMELLTNAETARTMAALLDVLTDDALPAEDRMPLGTIRRLLHSMSSSRARAEIARMKTEEAMNATQAVEGSSP